MSTALISRFNAAVAALGPDSGYKPVKKFADRATAEKRVAAIEVEVASKTPALTLNTAVGTFKGPPSAERPVGLSRGEFDPDAIGEKRGLRFDLAASKTKVAPREGTMRAKLLCMLQEAGAKGVDFEELHKACGFLNRKSTRDALGLLARKNGFGLKGTEACVRLG